jgi:hypothetical protein
MRLIFMPDRNQVRLINAVCHGSEPWASSPLHWQQGILCLSSTMRHTIDVWIWQYNIYMKHTLTTRAFLRRDDARRLSHGPGPGCLALWACMFFEPFFTLIVALWTSKCIRCKEWSNRANSNLLCSTGDRNWVQQWEVKKMSNDRIERVIETW